MALRTPGFAGADLANLLNEAAILAGRKSLPAVRNQEIDEAVDRIVAGMEGKPLTDGKAKSLVAYHEVSLGWGSGSCGSTDGGMSEGCWGWVCACVGVAGQALRTARPSRWWHTTRWA